MKNILYIVCLFFSLNVIAQAAVGINTTTPRKTLEVGGSMYVDGALTIGNYDNLQDGEARTFLKVASNDIVRVINLSNPTSTALGYIQKYVIQNPDLDWVLDFDTGIDATDFVLIATSSSYNKELVMSTGGASNASSLPYTATFISGGTWHIIADYPSAANKDHTDAGEWIINTLIFSRDLSKQFGTITVPMLNSTTGAAITPIID